MQRKIQCLLLASASLAFANPPEADRRAILAMAGKFDVTFDFQETAVLASAPKSVSDAYHEVAVEVVTVAEDTPERITLQHLLVVGKSGKSKVIKHWAQVWTWQDNRILDYAGSDGVDVWQRKSVSSADTLGRWSQLVTSVDDTPRYESLGRWVHQSGESSWTSDATRRPLPRREYEVRDDYDYLIVTNRHTLTPTGWVHFQDNRKVVDRDGEKAIIAHESGLNRYTRTENVSADLAVEWWRENAMVWNSIRNFWIEAGQREGANFAYLTTTGGVGISRKFRELEKEKPPHEAVVQALSPYLAISR